MAQLSGRGGTVERGRWKNEGSSDLFRNSIAAAEPEEASGIGRKFITLARKRLPFKAGDEALPGVPMFFGTEGLFGVLWAKNKGQNS